MELLDQQELRDLPEHLGWMDLQGLREVRDQQEPPVPQGLQELQDRLELQDHQDRWVHRVLQD